MSDFSYILASVLIVSAVSLSGIFLLLIRREVFKKILPTLVALASGTLLGGAFLHLLPEGLEGMKSDSGFILVLAGILLFFALEKFFHWHHCHQEACDVHVKPFAWLNLLGDGIHNFLDGLIIAVTYMVDINLGMTATLAIIFHEIPQELGDFAVLVAGGLSVKKALYFNFFTALTAVIGALVGYQLGQSVVGISYLLTLFAGGGFIYIAAVDLIPELHKEITPRESLLQFFALLGGVLLMWGLKLL